MKRITQKQIDKIKNNVKLLQRYMNIYGKDFSNCDFSELDFSYANFRLADFGSANFRSANFRSANFRLADFGLADFRFANFRLANFGSANFGFANFWSANFRLADFGSANFRFADFGSANFGFANFWSADFDYIFKKRLISNIKKMSKMFDKTSDGFIVYKSFGENYKPPKKWNIGIGNKISQRVDTDRFNLCSYGINVSTLEWCKQNCSKQIYKLLVPFTAELCVPYDTDGKVRVSEAIILEAVK